MNSSRSAIGVRPRNRLLTLIRHVMCALSLLIVSSQGFAECYFTNGQSAHVYTITVPALGSGRDLPVGTQLSKGSLQSIPATGEYARCSYPGVYLKTVPGMVGALVGGVYTYPSGIDGIGIQFFDGSDTFSATNTGSFAGSWGFNRNQFGIAVVRVPFTGVGKSSGTVAPIAGIFSLDGLAVATITFQPFDVGVKTCTVTTPSIAVELQPAELRKLRTVNSTIGDTPFNLGLSCDPGMNVAVTITDVSNPANLTTTLSLGHDASAKGVGYQILNNGVPIAFGPDSAAAGTANQFTIVPLSVQGSYTIPLVARYIRTGTMVPGSANAYATFTMSYQ
jgi:type 1 fimbria pilin